MLLFLHQDLLILLTKLIGLEFNSGKNNKKKFGKLKMELLLAHIKHIIIMLLLLYMVLAI
jgi:hypothetical protein